MPDKVDIDEWKERVEGGVRYKEKFGNAKEWSTYREYYRGEFPGYQKSLAGDGVLPFNLTYAMKQTLVPNVYFRNPYVSASPRFKPGFDVAAKVVEAVDNWLLQEMAVKSAMKHSVGNCYFTNRAFLKIGYDSEFGYDPRLVKKDLGITDATASMMDKKLRNRLEYNANIHPGMPWVQSVPSENIIVPFGSYDFESIPWIDHIVLRRLEDVRADSKYNKAVTKELTGTHIETLKKDVKRANFYAELEKDADWVELHEIRDLRDGRIKVFSYGADDWLRNDTDILQVEGLPFVSYTFNDDTEYFWGPSDACILEPQQLEMNESRTQAMKHRRISLLKFLIEEQGMDKEEADKMISEEVGPAVFTKGKPKETVTTLQPHIPPDLLQWTEFIRGDARELIGIGRQQAGQESRSSRRTATESQIVQSAHELRMDERRDALADALVKTMRKVNQIVFKRWSAERVVQVVGIEGARHWVKFNNQAIVGEYDLTVDVESMTPTTKAIRRRDIVQLIQALARVPGANIDYLMRSLLREFPYIDAMKVLPLSQEAQRGQSVGVEQFGRQQQGLLNSPAAHRAATDRSISQIQAA